MHIWGACLGGKAQCREDAGLKSGSLVPVPATLERGDYLMGACFRGIDNILIVVGVPRWKESAAVQSILHHSCFPLCSVRLQPPQASSLLDQHCHLQAARATPTPRSAGGQPYCLLLLRLPACGYSLVLGSLHGFQDQRLCWVPDSARASAHPCSEVWIPADLWGPASIPRDLLSHKCAIF